MRKFVKTVAVLALAVAVLSTSAFAALTKNPNGTYSVEVTGAGEQVTLFAVSQAAIKEEAGNKLIDFTKVNDNNIYYIDQNDSGNFSNFQLKGDVAGNEIFFFAGSDSSADYALVDSVENLIITISTEGGVTTVEEGEELVFSAGYTGGNPEIGDWSVTGGATISPIGNGLAGATFVANEAGDYTVKVTMNGFESNTITITVTEPSFDLTPSDSDVITTEPDGNVVQVQHGVGVMIDVDVPAAIDKMIWVLVGSDGTRYYSDAIDYIQGTAGNVKAYAAFPNGNNGISTNTVEIIGVDAIFRVDDKTAYYTNEAEDRANGPDAYKAAE